MLRIAKREVRKEIPVSVQRLFGLMLVTEEVCVLFLIKLRWPMRKSTKLTYVFSSAPNLPGKLPLRNVSKKEIA